MTKEILLPTVVDVETVAELVEQGAPIQIVDVRTPAEFEALHIAGSHNIPLDALPEHRAALCEALQSPTVLICRSGMRARQAEQLLREVDVRVHVLDGGVGAWEAAGKPVVRGRQRWSMERQVRGVAGALVLLGTLSGLLWKRPLTLLATMIGAGLTYSALTDSCGMAVVLSKLPYNRGSTCDVRAAVERLVDAGTCRT